MKEIEVKILEIDIGAVVDRLRQAGAEKVESGLVRATSFDFPDHRLRDTDSFVRVRSIGGRVELVLKKTLDKGDYKVCDETETTVGDYDAACRFFEGLGMELFSRYEKYRATYRLDNLKFEFDKYPSAPWFVEIEAPSEADVKKGVTLLGLDMSRTTSMSGRDVCRKYGLGGFFTFSEKGESPDHGGLFED